MRGPADRHTGAMPSLPSIHPAASLGMGLGMTARICLAVAAAVSAGAVAATAPAGAGTAAVSAGVGTAAVSPGVGATAAPAGHAPGVGPGPSATAPRNARATQEQARPAQRIVSLVPAATEALFAMGAGASVVGVSSYDTWPPEVADLPKIGALLNPDEERILRLQPDFAVLDPSQAALARKLESAGIPSYAFEHADLEAAFAAMEDVARAIGRARDGAALTARVRRELAEVRERYAAAPRPRTLIVFARTPGSFHNLYVIGGGGFINELVEIAGGTNVFADVERMSFKVGLEAVLSRAPEVVIEARPARGRVVDAAATAQEWRGLPGFAGVKVAVLTDDSMLVPGPRMPRAARLFAEQLHGGNR